MARLAVALVALWAVCLVPAWGLEKFDFCVVGAGPGGLQMAYFMARANRSFVVLERNDVVGSFYTTMPRHRKLISINKRFTGHANEEYNLRHDWHSLISDNSTLKFTRYSSDFFPQADDYLTYLADYAKYTGVEEHIRFSTQVFRVKRRGHKWFSLHVGPAGSDVEADTTSVLRCRRVIAATGYAKENVPEGIEGMELVTSYSEHDLRPETYRNQSVLILGMANTAFEIAQHIMAETSTIHMVSRTGSPVWAWETHYVGDLRAVNDLLADNYQLKSQDVFSGMDVRAGVVRFESKPHPDDPKRSQVCAVNMVSEKEATAVRNGSVPEGVWDQYDSALSIADRVRSRRTVCFDHVIRSLGWGADFDPFAAGGLNVERHRAADRLPRLTPLFESSSEQELFFIGALGHGLDYRISAGGFIHGFRYTVRAVWRMLEVRYHARSQATWAPGAPVDVLPDGTVRSPDEALMEWPMFTAPPSAWPGSMWTAASPAALARAILGRIQVASGPYQMFSFLGDVVVLPQDWSPTDYGADSDAILPTDDAPALYMEEVPIAATGFAVPPSRGALAWSFKYGKGFKGHETVFASTRLKHFGDPHHAHRSQFLHPTVVAVTPQDASGNRKAFTLHLLEDFLTEFDQDLLYLHPLTTFIEQFQATGQPQEKPSRPSDAPTMEHWGPPSGFLPGQAPEDTNE